MDKPIAKVWLFASESKPAKRYQTMQYHDGSTSCNCPGWCKRTASDGSRSCRHTRLVDMGQADQQAITSQSYSRPAKPGPTPRPTAEIITVPVGRRFDFAA